MDVLLYSLGVLMLYWYFIWRTVSIGRRFSPWVLPAVLVLDHILVFVAFGVVFVAWKMWFFWAAFRWDPLRGAFRTPRWPRAPIFRGPGRRRPRQFSEPLPWTAGPVTR